MKKKLLSIMILVVLIGVSAQPSSNASASAPAVEWQKDYGHSGPYDDTNVESASNLIQASDGGYIFMDLGWRCQGTFMPSTVYKVDTSGSLQWSKTVDYFIASTIIQTNDEGYEIAGQWYSPTYEYTPTFIKMDSEGNMQWVANQSSVPNLGITSVIQTSDGGFAYWTAGNITKTDSNNNTQWVKSLNYTGADGTAAITLSSVVETFDGALAALGVGYSLFDNPRTGRLYLVKMETFLPLPNQAPLPTPVSKPPPTKIVETIIVIILIVGVVAIVSLLVYFKKRKH